MLIRGYKHKRRLTVLNILSVIFILFIWWFSYQSRGHADAGTGLIVIAPIFWIVWLWTGIADLLLVINLVLRKFGLYPKRG
jgi:hypothetical protein